MDADGWNERYQQGRVWSVEPNRFFAEAVASLPGEGGRRAVDLACGEGRNAVWLAQRGWEVTAVDFSSAGIDRGRVGAANLGAEIDWQVGDLRDWDLGSARWDLVAHVYLHWSQAEREPFLQRCADAVAPGGFLIIVGHDRSNIADGVGGPQDPEVLTTPGELDDLLSAAGLHSLRCETVLRPVTGADPHRAESAVKVDAIDHVFVGHRPASLP